MDILVIKSSPVDADKMNLQIVYDMEAHYVMVTKLQVQLEKIPEAFLTFVDEFLTELTKFLAEILDETIKEVFAEVEDYYNYFVENLGAIEIEMPGGDVMTGAQIWEPVSTSLKTTYEELMDFVTQTDSLYDTLMKEIDDMLDAAVENVEYYTDPEYLDAVTKDLSDLYENLTPDVKNILEQVIVQYKELRDNVDELIKDILNYLFGLYIIIIIYLAHLADYLSQVSENAKPYFGVSDGRLEINVTFPFRQ